MLVHHNFMHLLGGRTWTNSIGEGQNAALKSANGGTRANYNTDTLFETLTAKAILKNQFINERFERSSFNIPTNVHSPDAPLLTKHAIGKWRRLCDSPKQYFVWKRTEDTAWVCRKKWGTASSDVIRICRVRVQKAISSPGQQVSNVRLVSAQHQGFGLNSKQKYKIRIRFQKN